MQHGNQESLREINYESQQCRQADASAEALLHSPPIKKPLLQAHQRGNKVTHYEIVIIFDVHRFADQDPS